MICGLTCCSIDSAATRKRILDRERRARAVGDDANAVDAEERGAAVFLVVHLFPDRAKGILREVGAGHAHWLLDQLVLEPFENRVADRFAGFENHVADEAVADHHLDRMREKIVAFDVAAEIELAPLQHLENFLGQVGSL